MLLAAGCERAPATVRPEPAVTVRDSAGVEIVDVPREALDRLPHWRVGTQPLVSIGEVDAPDADDPYLFSGIASYHGVTLLHDGSLAIADGVGQSGSREIRVFDAEGRFLHRMGREGAGPGEFRSAPDIQGRLEGGVVALSRSERRVTVFDAEGRLVETFPILAADRCPQSPCHPLRGLLGSGAVPLGFSGLPPVVDESTLGRTFALDAAYVLAMKEGYHDLGSFPTTPIRVSWGSFPNGRQVMVRQPPMRAMGGADAAAGREHVVVTLADRYELRIFDDSARLLRVVRVHGDPPPFTAEEQRAILEAEATWNEGWVEGRPVAPRPPAFGRVLFGEGDDIWVWDYRHPGVVKPGAAEWITIFGVDGVPVARLEVRADPVYRDQVRGFRYETVSGRERFRIVTSDPLGVNRVLVFPIEK